MSAPVVAISIGCPSGVGPEVAVAAAAHVEGARLVLVGDVDVIRRAARLRRVAIGRLVAVDGKRAVAALGPGRIGVWVASTPVRALPEYGAPTADAGAAQLAWVDEATDLVEAGVARALVTGPVSKHAIATSGVAEAKAFRGHTEHLAARLGAREVVMAFRSDRLTTALVTTHLPLARVPEAITAAAVATATYWLATLVRRLGCRKPKLVVAALNPHAGEHRLLGTEDDDIIAPAVEQARAALKAQGMDARIDGPTPAEAAFRIAFDGGYDGVVAMYHDQGTIPMKVRYFGKAVNVTAGLPIVRTSVDHGTAYDIAGTGKAEASSMVEAMKLAGRLAKR